MDDDHAPHHQDTLAERPTDRACPGCRVCACYETESDRRAMDEADDHADPTDHNHHAGHTRASYSLSSFLYIQVRFKVCND